MEFSLPLRSRLDSLQKGFNLYGEPPSKSLQSMIDNVNVNALQFEASVMDGPVISSRAGLYICINAMVFLTNLGILGSIADYLACWPSFGRRQHVPKLSH
jgi:hypothetical protein